MTTLDLRTAPKEATSLHLALAALILAAATIGGAWLFQLAGYLPCELCLEERWPYYIGVPYAAVVALICWRGPLALRRPALVLLALIFIGSAAFGAYHAGVEWKFWPGPTGCTGPLTSASSMTDFLHQLQTIKVVRCDAVAIRILGLSLAGWNCVISLMVAGLAFAGATRPR